MSSTHSSTAVERTRPIFDRYALIVGILVVVSVSWIGEMDSNDELLITSGSVPAMVEPSASITTKVEMVDVPAHYSPDDAAGTDMYIAAREMDCGRTARTAPHDYPSGWLRP